MNDADQFFRERVYRMEWCVDKGGIGSTVVFSWHVKRFPKKSTTTTLSMRESNGGYA